MNKIYSDSAEKARSYYINFTDILHDITHSERVADNAKLIANELGYTDLDFLELAALWHDVARTQGREPHEEEGALMARDDLLSRYTDKDLANSIYEAIRFHKSTASPVTVEGKIIRDADKLDIFSPVRLERCLKTGWTEEYTEDLKKTIENLNRYPDVFTYDYTKQLYRQRLPAYLDFVDKLKKSLRIDA